MRPVKKNTLCVLTLALCLFHGDDLRGQQQPYRFEARVQTVYVDVFVSDDGKPVLGLGTENFEVRDNGVRQELELIDVGEVPTSAMLVLDVSGSVVGSKLRHLRRAAHAFVEGLEDDDEAGLITVTQKLRLAKRLDNDFPALHRALDQPMEGGATALADGLFAGLKLLESANGRPVLLLFTDGMDNMSWLSESDVLDVVEATEAIIYVVGVRSRGGVHQFGRPRGGSGVDVFFEQMAQSTGGQVWLANSSVSLEEVFLGILEEMDTRYLLSFQPRGEPKKGWHELDVRLKGRKANRVRARSGYMVPEGKN
jgi:VWFA-related protein